LREYLGRQLPDYMLPAAYGYLDDFPLTPNSKVDRRAFPAPNALDQGRTAAEIPLHTQPRSTLEVEIAEVWKELLGLTAVGVEDNFFDLGGHSLLIVQLHRRLLTMNWSLSLTDLFRFPTIRALAQYLGDSSAELELSEATVRAGTRQGMLARRFRRPSREDLPQAAP